MNIFEDFKKFISRGNVVDLAVGVIIGAAFGKVVSSVVDDIIMPPLGLAIGGVDFKNLKVILKAADPLTKAPEVAWKYGNFIQNLFDFLIIAIAIFAIVKIVSIIERRQQAAPPPPAPPPPPTKDQELLTEIRDLLKSNPPEKEPVNKPA